MQFYTYIYRDVAKQAYSSKKMQQTATVDPEPAGQRLQVDSDTQKGFWTHLGVLTKCCRSVVSSNSQAH
jgi:hypothetical protein